MRVKRPTPNRRELMLDSAIAYLRDKMNVIPLGQDKKPLVKWGQYQTDFVTERQATRWWDKEFPGANIGIVTGETSGIDVIDCDTVTTEAIFLKLIGAAENIPKVRTPRGGCHFYFSHVPGIGDRTGIIENVDCRGQGGYVVAPPSFVNYLKDGYGRVRGPYVWELGYLEAD